jgi:hypothetical protein
LARCAGVGMFMGGSTGLWWVSRSTADSARAESIAAAAAMARDAVGGSSHGEAARLTTESNLSGAEIAAASSSALKGGATASATAPLPDWVRLNPRGSSVCGKDMVLVEGTFCATVHHRCISPFDDGSGRCRRYAESSRCSGRSAALRYCIDRYEYPNREGMKPSVMIDFSHAKATCEAEGKRLCNAREWTLACEGPERYPYPHGYVRDSGACNVDQAHRFPDADALARAESREGELKRLDQRAASGARARCVSGYGVYDLVGNVDEWVNPDGTEEAAGPSPRTALKGGYYGPVRARCRPTTTSHGTTFKFYQVGFRCCADPGSDGAIRSHVDITDSSTLKAP